MEFSENNNIFQYSNHKSIRKFKKQLGGIAKKISNPDNDDILLMKIYLKIYIRLFLYIQYKLNKKFITGDAINNPYRAINQRTLVDAMNLYREDVEMQTYLQSTDLFFIRPLFESMCRDNYNDICIQYFNSFILPKKEFDPQGVKQIMEKIIGKYFNLMKDYETLANKKAYQDILNYVRDLDGQLSEDDFVKLMQMIKREIEKFKKSDTREKGRGLREREPSQDNQQLNNEIELLKTRIQKLESSKNQTDIQIKELEDSPEKVQIMKKIDEELKKLNTKFAENLRKKIDELASITSQQIENFKSLISKLENELEEIRRKFQEEIQKKRDSSITKDDKYTELDKLISMYKEKITELEKEIANLKSKINKKKLEPIDVDALRSFNQVINLFKEEGVSPSEEPIKTEILASLKKLLEEIQTTNKSIVSLLGKKLEVSVEGMAKLLEFIENFHSKLDEERKARIAAERKLQEKILDKEKTIASQLSTPTITIAQIQELIDAQTNELKELLKIVRPHESSTLNFQDKFNLLETKLQKVEQEVQNTSEQIKQLDVKFKEDLEKSKKEIKKILVRKLAVQELLIKNLRKEFAGMFQDLSQEIRDNIQQLANLTNFKRDELNLQKLAIESMRDANNNLLSAIEKSSSTLESIAKAAFDSKTAQQDSSRAKEKLDDLKIKSLSNEEELQRLREQLNQAHIDNRELIQKQLDDANTVRDRLLEKILTQETVVTDAGRRESDTTEATKLLVEEQRRHKESIQQANLKLVEAKEEQVRREREHTKFLEKAMRESQDQFSRQLDEEKQRYDAERRDRDKLQEQLTAELRRATELAQAKSQKEVQIQSTSQQPDSEKLMAKLEKDREELKRQIDRTNEIIISKSAEIDAKVNNLEKLQDYQIKIIESLRSQTPAPIHSAQGPSVIVNNNISPAPAQPAHHLPRRNGGIVALAVRGGRI